MSSADDPRHLSERERVEQIASILAAGILRLRKHCVAASNISPNSGDQGLELSGETSLTVHAG